MLKEEFICLDMDCDTKEQALEILAKLFVKGGVVKESFVQAVIEREKVYPTALPGGCFDIAIPHTVSKHVNEPAMAVGVLKKPIEFQQMGSPEITLKPQLLIMLAISDPKQQLSLLRKIMKLIQDDDLLNQIKNAKTQKEILDLMLPRLN